MSKYKIHPRSQGHAGPNYNLSLKNKSNSEKPIQRHSHAHSMNICFEENSAELVFFNPMALFILLHPFQVSLSK